MNVRAHEAAARIKEESNGRIEIQIFPNNQLGGDTDMCRSCAAAPSSSSPSRA
jgi:TRAP-type C4-dicarboxylate transport system substrate-binding protein